MSRHPEIVWAQRSEKIYLTVELPDAKDTKVNVTPEGTFSYSAASGPENIPYAVELELFGPIDVDSSKMSVGLRHTFCVLAKKEKEWWKRLLKAEGKPPPYVKVDWNKWVDEDEEPEKEDTGMGNFDLSAMNDFSKFGLGDTDGGLPEDDEDEDDEPAELVDPSK